MPSEPIDEPDWWTDLHDFHADLEDAARLERDAFICPISHEIMRHPVMLTDREAISRKYEHDQVARWLAEGNTTEPTTGEEMSRREVIKDAAMAREIRNWCEAKVSAWRSELASTARASSTAAERQQVHVFIDHSNIFVGARRAGKELQPVQLARYVHAGRTLEQGVVVGSNMRAAQQEAWKQLQYSVVADPRNGPEHFVDEALHAQLMKTAAQSFAEGRVMTLVTGDGNANEGRTTFPDCVLTALKNNWHVELCSWRAGTSQAFYRIAKEYPDVFRIRHLDTLFDVG